MTSLSAIGTPSPLLAHDVEVGVQLGVARLDRLAVGADELVAGDLAALEQAGRVLGRESTCRSQARAPRPSEGPPRASTRFERSAENRTWARESRRDGDEQRRRRRCSSDRRHAEAAVLRVGRVRERLLARERGPRLVLGPDVHDVERVRRRLDVRRGRARRPSRPPRGSRRARPARPRSPPRGSRAARGARHAGHRLS